MQLIRRRAHSRAGLLGNPSDGYHGKTISLIVRDYSAQVVLYDWPRLEVIPSQEDQRRFESIHELARDVELHGYYGGTRLIKAAIKRFHQYCVDQEIPLHDRNFSIRYESDIPRQVGLAGSSAIIVATLRVLKAFYGVEIPREVEPSLALSVETGELGIAAGLQDRVVQVYEGMVYMDFGEDVMERRQGLTCGRYEPLAIERMPPLYVAYSIDAGSPTEIFHNNLRQRFLQGEPAVVESMRKFARLAAEGKEALQAGDVGRLSALIDENFDTRQSICRLPEAHVAMVEAARRAGASAKFCGSGGAIIGTYSSEAVYERLCRELRKLECHVFKPRVAPE
jgi:glucuronokinase